MSHERSLEYAKSNSGIHSGNCQSNLKSVILFFKMKTLNVVGAVITNDEGQILVAQRPYSEVSYKSYKWEFPGGKVEDKESHRDALVREIREELECDIDVKEKLGELEYDYPDFKLNMSLYLCRLKEGSTPTPVEHNRIKWISLKEIDTLDWLEADYKILPIIQKRLIRS